MLWKSFVNVKKCAIFCIKNDHGGEFENHDFENFCNNFGIKHQFSSLRTLQQNGGVEGNNKFI